MESYPTLTSSSSIDVDCPSIDVLSALCKLADTERLEADHSLIEPEKEDPTSRQTAASKIQAQWRQYTSTRVSRTQPKPKEFLRYRVVSSAGSRIRLQKLDQGQQRLEMDRQLSSVTLPARQDLKRLVAKKANLTLRCARIPWLPLEASSPSLHRRMAKQANRPQPNDDLPAAQQQQQPDFDDLETERCPYSSLLAH